MKSHIAICEVIIQTQKVGCKDSKCAGWHSEVSAVTCRSSFGLYLLRCPLSPSLPRGGQMLQEPCVADHPSRGRPLRTHTLTCSQLLPALMGLRALPWCLGLRPLGQFGLTPWNTGYTPCKPGVPPLLVLSCSCHQPRGSHTAPPTPPSAPCPGTAPLHQPTLHGSPLPPGQKPSLTSKHLQGSPWPPFPPPFPQPRHPLLITLCSFSTACCCFQMVFSFCVFAHAGPSARNAFSAHLSPATTSSGFYILHRQPPSFTQTLSHMQSQSPFPPVPSACSSLCQAPHCHSSLLLQTVSISKAETRPGLFTTESQR